MQRRGDSQASLCAGFSVRPSFRMGVRRSNDGERLDVHLVQRLVVKVVRVVLVLERRRIRSHEGYDFVT